MLGLGLMAKVPGFAEARSRSWRSKCSADLFCRSAAFLPLHKEPRTYKSGPRYTLSVTRRLVHSCIRAA